MDNIYRPTATLRSDETNEYVSVSTRELNRESQ